MKGGKLPDPDTGHPMAGYADLIYARPTVTGSNIIVGDFTYIADSDFGRHVSHHYDFIGDNLIIGKFCQIAAGVEFVMSGANHQMNAVSTFPFHMLGGWRADSPSLGDLPLRGGTVIGNDVWIGQNATILPGVHVGYRAIIGVGAVVGADVGPYAVVAGNPARQVRRRFDDDLIEPLERVRWWDKEVEEIRRLVPLLTSGDLEMVRSGLRRLA